MTHDHYEQLRDVLMTIEELDQEVIENATADKIIDLCLNIIRKYRNYRESNL